MAWKRSSFDPYRLIRYPSFFNLIARRSRAKGAKPLPQWANLNVQRMLPSRQQSILALPDILPLPGTFSRSFRSQLRLG